jgi:hypothetical protein
LTETLLSILVARKLYFILVLLESCILEASKIYSEDQEDFLRRQEVCRNQQSLDEIACQKHNRGAVARQQGTYCILLKKNEYPCWHIL